MLLEKIIEIERKDPFEKSRLKNWKVKWDRRGYR